MSGIEITQQLKDKNITASGLIDSGETPLYHFYLTASDADATLDLFDSLDGSGTATNSIECNKNTTVIIDWSKVGPKMFRTGLYAELSGSGASAHFWYA
jgi:hypothetical protein